MIESLKKFWILYRENVSYQNGYDFTAHLLVVGSLIFMFLCWEMTDLPSKYGTLVFWVGIGIASLLFRKADKIRHTETLSGKRSKWQYTGWGANTWGITFLVIGCLFVVPNFLLD